MRLIAWLKDRGIAFWLLTTVGSAVIGWGVKEGMPVLWRSITKPEPVSVHVDPNPRGITEAPTLGNTNKKREPKRPKKPDRAAASGTDTTGGGDEAGSTSDAALATFATQNDPRVFEKGPDWTGYTWVIPRPLEEVPPPPKGLCRDRRSWAYDLEGADAQFTVVQATLQGDSPGTVVIDGLEVEVVERARPIAGTWADCPVGGADASPRMIQIDLDRTPPTIKYYEEGGTQVPRLTLTLKKTEIEIFQIWATATTCYCTWRLKLFLIEAGKRRELVIDEGGQPFRTTGTGRAVRAVWEQGTWVEAG